MLGNREVVAVVSGFSGKKLGVMQPYFLPYIGYFQLIAAVDIFVVYDNIEYTKKGWINRNRMLRNGSDAVFSLPLKKGSDSLCVVDRHLSSDFKREKLLAKFAGAYRKAPHYERTFDLLSKLLRYPNSNLFDYLWHSVVCINEHLGIDTKLLASSQVSIDHDLRSQDKILALCQEIGATAYVNPMGGRGLYSRSDFGAVKVDLQFLKTRPTKYSQFEEQFVPWLSIVDVLMFNELEEAKALVRTGYDLVRD
jgi:hypothetical protein